MARVLVVDDDRAIRDLLCFALEGEGYEVLALADGEGVVDALAEADAPMVVLMDLMMPRVDGWAVCQRLLAEHDGVGRHALVVMTASMLDAGERPAPARALVRKPFALDDIFRLVAAQFAELTVAEAVPHPESNTLALALAS